MAFEWPADVDPLEEGHRLAEEYGIDQSNYRLMDCWVCHR